MTGLRAAARRRIGKAVHKVGGVTRTDIRQLRGELQQLRDELGEQRKAAVQAAELAAANRQLRAELTAAAELQQHSSASLGDLEARASELEETTATLQEGEAAYAAELATLAGIEALSRWLRHAPLATNPLVSVIVPTCNRPQLLDRAIQSVLAQRYGHWELIVVDDGGNVNAGAVVERAEHDRISLMRTVGTGLGAARNTGLGAARGEIVTYLDDDNFMDSDWLYAVVWAFEQRPDVDVLYGAQVVDDMNRLLSNESRSLPSLHLEPFDRDTLCTRNLSDAGAIAHRSGLEQARFDEELRQLEDWDFLLRVTSSRDPLVLPAIAVYYTTDAPNRLTGITLDEAAVEEVRRRAARGEYP